MGKSGVKKCGSGEGELQANICWKGSWKYYKKGERLDKKGVEKKWTKGQRRVCDPQRNYGDY